MLRPRGFDARVLILAAILLCGTAEARTPATPEALADAYLSAVVHEDWPAARALWHPAEIAASERLGIVYRDQPFKTDAASLLVLERRACRSGTIDAFVDEVDADASTARIRYNLRAGDEAATVPYHATSTPEGWRLVSAATALSTDWTRRQTEYLDLRIQPPLAISDTAVTRIDRFVADTCARLAVSPARLDHLRGAKLGYYLCDEATVAEIVGAETRGVALLPSDAVVTSEPCHLHELAHLLVNYAAGELPLYTLPFLQEGAAVALGGRWGRAPRVMEVLGRFTLREELLDIDDLLSWHGFHSHSPDLTYAPSGLLAGYLLERLGGERFLDLYVRLSGGLDELRRLDAAAVRAHLTAVADCDWPVLREELDNRMEEMSCGGILGRVAVGGEILAEARDDRMRVTVRDQGPWLAWRVVSEEGPATGAVLVSGTRRASASRLFAEHFPRRPDGGEPMALIFSPAEVGLYDFRTDLLLAKFVAGFCPGESIAGADEGELSFLIDKDLFPEGGWELEPVSDR